MPSNIEESSVTLHGAPMKTPGSIATVEQYHSPLHSAYTRIRNDLGQDTTEADCLSMAVLTVKRDSSPRGLVPHAT